MKSDFWALGIETSCDDTSASVVDGTLMVLSSVVGSQEIVHARHGGVVPELASRKHSENIIPVIDAALGEAGKSLDEIDLVAVTRGPGLVGSLLVGFMAAKGLAWGLGLPLVGVNHLAAHVWAAALDSGARKLPNPSVCLIVSGGHTDLLYYAGERSEYLGGTRDDAAGEAYDKVARALGLSYPGGPIIDRIASSYRGKLLDLPRPMLQSGDFDFSFSGLKTAVAVASEGWESLDGASIESLAASFQEAVVDVLVTKAMAALEATGADNLIAAGGVAANSRLRSRLRDECASRGARLFIPPLKYCTDNAAMVAAAGINRYLERGADDRQIDVDPGLSLRREDGGINL
ncbi:MAG: tRNA (adenosine(37)-N6)-threonylcarbamoyltransferase complex transferase subunit TsaD [Bacillota bacterium]